MPQSKLTDRVNGIQILGWGAHSPRCPSHSSPPELFDEIVAEVWHPSDLQEDDVHSMGDAAAMERLQKRAAHWNPAPCGDLSRSAGA